MTFTFDVTDRIRPGPALLAARPGLGPGGRHPGPPRPNDRASVATGYWTRRKWPGRRMAAGLLEGSELLELRKLQRISSDLLSGGLL